MVNNKTNKIKHIVACMFLSLGLIGVINAETSVEDFIKQQVVTPYKNITAREFACSQIIIPHYVNSVTSANELFILCNNYIENSATAIFLFNYISNKNNIIATPEEADSNYQDNLDNANPDILPQTEEEQGKEATKIGIKLKFKHKINFIRL